jgi:hypothetical protein
MSYVTETFPVPVVNIFLSSIRAAWYLLQGVTGIMPRTINYKSRYNLRMKTKLGDYIIWQMWRIFFRENVEIGLLRPGDGGQHEAPCSEMLQPQSKAEESGRNRTGKQVRCQWYCQCSSSSEHFCVIYTIRCCLRVNHPVDHCATGDARPRNKDSPLAFTFIQATSPWGVLPVISPSALVTHRMEHCNNSRQSKHHAGTTMKTQK